MITRRMLPNGQDILITDHGMLTLQKEYQDYKQIFGHYEEIRLNGLICTGLGEGRYYTTLEGYQQQFEQKLGFKPYPGTLNIELNPSDINVRKRLDLLDDIRIDGFEDGVRTFGSVKCFRVKIDGVCGAIVIPIRKHYPDNMLEVIAPVNLREHLHVSDGSKLEVIVCKT